MSIQQATLEVRDQDSTGELPDTISSALLGVSSVEVSILEEGDDKYLLSVQYEDVEDVQDVVCAIAMLCMSNGIYHFSMHYMGKEGGTAQW